MLGCDFNLSLTPSIKQLHGRDCWPPSMDRHRLGIGQSTGRLWLQSSGTWTFFGSILSQDKLPMKIPHQRAVVQPTSRRLALSRQCLRQP